jgi:D-alanine-D-alanine ligase
MQKINVGVFFGGVSPEHEVSIESARGVVAKIDKEKFIIKQIYIDKQGKFLTGDGIIKKIQVGNIDGLKKVDLNELRQEIAVAFPVLHGAGGEDGSIQGFFQTIKLPFVGAGILASAVCLDKGVFNQLMVIQGIRKPRFIIIDNKIETIEIKQEKISSIKKDFKFPVFVKPARTGSSVGVYKVKEPEVLESFIDKAVAFDNKIVVEEAVNDCREIEVSVLGNSTDDFEVSLPGEVFPGAEFYDYDDKYKNNQAKFDIPAKLSPEKTAEIQRIALDAYKITNCEGLARVDFLLDKEETVFLNEINTLRVLRRFPCIRNFGRFQG